MWLWRIKTVWFVSTASITLRAHQTQADGSAAISEFVNDAVDHRLKPAGAMTDPEHGHHKR